MLRFTSAFGERISSFLDDRTARGYNPETWIRHFIKFDRWIAQTHPNLTELTRETVHEWLNDSSATPHDISQRASAMRMFGKYLHALGEKAYILPGKYSSAKHAFVPYIFTDAEMTALSSEIDALPPTQWRSDSLAASRDSTAVLDSVTASAGIRPRVWFIRSYRTACVFTDA